MKGLPITEKSKTGKIIRMFGIEECNIIEEDMRTKVKVLTSEILVTIPNKLGSNKFKTYIRLIDNGTHYCLMDKYLTSIHELDENVNLSQEKWLT